jgi:DNA-directed RNA polymerase specialized sigma24 family protein
MEETIGSASADAESCCETDQLPQGGRSKAEERDYVRRAYRARKRMTPVQRAVFDAMLVDRLPYGKAAKRLGLDEEETLHLFVRVFRLFVDAIEAPPRPWWRWW